MLEYPWDDWVPTLRWVMDPQATGIAMMTVILAAFVVYLLYVREGW